MKPNLNILVAEDNADDLFLLHQAFKKSGVGSRLHSVSDGRQALAWLQGENEYADRNACPLPDLLLLDLNMPRMNGFELLEWIRHDRQQRCLPIHVLSASPRQADIQRAYELGANSYIIKPSRIDELVALVTALHQWHSFVSLPDWTENIPA